MVAVPTCGRRGLLRTIAFVGVLVLGGPASTRAQQPGEVSGRVAYSGTGQPVPGAVVMLHEAGLSLLTDADGRYRFRDVPPGRHVALAALIGCIVASRTIDVQPGRRVTLNLRLDPPVVDIQGLVVTATGGASGQDAFAIGRLDADGRVLVTGSTHSVPSMLQGQIAGVRVAHGSGQPGSEASIVLRAPNSLHASLAPLVVIDGVITEGRVSDIDPLDVLRVEVLRGAAASAGYGSRGQAGVIEITTRRGRQGPGASGRRPVMLVDGVISDGSVGSVNLAEIVDVRTLEGPVAAVLYGRLAEAGAIQVTTRTGPPAGAQVLRPACLDIPSRSP